MRKKKPKNDLFMILFSANVSLLHLIEVLLLDENVIW